MGTLVTRCAPSPISATALKKEEGLLPALAELDDQLCEYRGKAVGRMGIWYY
jgi:hypothetical protein